MIKLVDYDFLAATPSSMAGWSAARGGGGGTGEATYFDAAGNLQVATAGQWRVDHDPVTLARRGLLLEPGRTNFIRNPRMEGAVVGAPGTAPTNMVFSAGATGLTVEIVEISTENNMNCVSVRWSGTTVAGGRLFWFMELGGIISASIGQVFTASNFCKVVAGAFPVAGAAFQFQEQNSSLAVLVSSLVAAQVPAAVNQQLRASRRSAIYTMTQAAAAFVRPSWVSDFINSGTIVDVTIRFSIPQHELGAFATSPILPPVGVTTAAATRAADQGSVPVAATSRATLYLEEHTIAKGASGSLGALQADDGSANNRLNIAATGGTGYAPAITGSGTAIATFSTAAITDGVVDRAALAYAPNAMAAALDGASLGTDTSGSLAASISRIAITDGDRARHLRAIRLYAAGLTLAQVQSLTLDGAEPSPVGISLPAIRRPAEAAERLVGLTQSHQSPFDGTLQTLEMPGARWEFTATWPVLGPDDRRLMAAFLSSLRGMAGRFFFSPAQWSPRRATGGGAPVIDGDFQAGTTLATRGWTALGQAMRAGDWLSYVDTRGRRRLHMVVADASADAGGLAALLVTPPIRRAGADGVAIDVVAPAGVFMLPQDEAPQMNIRAPSLGQVTITMQEALA